MQSNDLNYTVLEPFVPSRPISKLTNAHLPPVVREALAGALVIDLLPAACARGASEAVLSVMQAMIPRCHVCHVPQKVGSGTSVVVWPALLVGKRQTTLPR